MKRLLLLLIFALFTVGTLVSLTQIRDAKPAGARLAFYPPAPVIRALTADQYQFVSHVISLQCLFYFGGLVEQPGQKPDWQRIYRALYTSTRSPRRYAAIGPSTINDWIILSVDIFLPAIQAIGRNM